MKKALLILFLYSSFSFSQTFTLATNTPFDNVTLGSVKFADVDGDLDNDVFISGADNTSGSTILYSKLYINDGSGSFSESTFTTFVGLDNSSVDFEDIDGDTDLDLIINGRMADNNPTTILFTNDGNGNFTEVTGTTFNIGSGIVNFEDIDGDLDQDILLVGDAIVQIYQNDGNGTFTEISANSITGIDFGDFEFFDKDGDLDSDLLIIGETYSAEGKIAKLYENDGNGNFSEVIGTSFSGLIFSSIDSDDIDDDNDLDLIITGQLSSNDPITSLFINDGNGNFSEVLNTPFEDVKLGEAIFADINDDNFPDVLLTGRLINDSKTTKLYLNDGSGNFTEATIPTFEGLDFISRIAAADIDGDSDLEIINIGSNSSFTSTTNLYVNNLYTLGIDDESINQFIIYPNPSTHIINIENQNNTHISEFLILDIKGRIIKQEKLNNETFYKIDINDLAQGTYLLELKTISGVFRKKILKN
ncbi:T9SS type A sorting domain-containing protein [uncultured Psychroserpens sp.]|uniref:T9SS type A sorting domain-containing protein n=1 Tax=uncultured Psychroserpens sp. TaxID=255436 RepID=UPI00261818A0|nr:T9SS type A sorting domain-containing protein [uncultured Psychroserpens sp.]